MSIVSSVADLFVQNDSVNSFSKPVGASGTTLEHYVKIRSHFDWLDYLVFYGISQDHLPDTLERIGVIHNGIAIMESNKFEVSESVKVYNWQEYLEHEILPRLEADISTRMQNHYGATIDLDATEKEIHQKAHQLFRLSDFNEIFKERVYYNMRGTVHQHIQNCIKNQTIRIHQNFE